MEPRRLTHEDMRAAASLIQQLDAATEKAKVATTVDQHMALWEEVGGIEDRLASILPATSTPLPPR